MHLGSRHYGIKQKKMNLNKFIIQPNVQKCKVTISPLADDTSRSRGSVQTPDVIKKSGVFVGPECK